MVPEDVVSGLDFSGPTLYAVRVNGGLHTMNPNDASTTLIGTMLDQNNAPLAAGDMTAPVPEPTTFVLLMFAAAGQCLRRGRAA
jgi:hypothetical protein